MIGSTDVAGMRLELKSADGRCAGILLRATVPRSRRPLLVCVHGGGCNHRYFEVARTPTASIAQAQGFDTLLLDRPGYGGTPVPQGGTPIADSVAIIRDFIDQVRRDHLSGSPGVVAIGHSIGGAVTLMLSAEPGWPLLAVAVSGVGDVPIRTSKDWPLLPAGVKSALPDTVPAAALFGPVGTFGWDAVGRLRRAGEPWVLAEVSEMVDIWPAWWRNHAAAIAVPVHLRLAQHESMWVTGPEAVERMAARLTGAPRLDAALLPDGGHLYELHHRGPELVEAQLRFLRELSDPG